MSDNPKFMIGERNTVDFEYDCEYIPDHSDILFENDQEGSQVNLSTIVGDRLNNVFDRLAPKDGSVSFTFSGIFPSTITAYSSNTQITANRLSQSTFVFSGILPSTITTEHYDSSDGTTVIRTVTETFTYSGGKISTVKVATT